ncbi:unnamed protein product [Penicillium salamii]|nr:unnamed protein product [Penicillium salamii]CAG8390156.1 unnamed protein product [Penicillium salamii]
MTSIQFPPGMPTRLHRATEKVKVMMKLITWQPKQEKVQGPGRCYLMELPTELLLEIVSHLTVLPEAALALTNKRMFAISGEILFSKSLRFSRDFAPLFHHYRNGHNFVTPRWSFLNLLENSRMKLCSKCLKLHPRDAFSARELRRKPENRTCNIGELAGIVDLCPCKKLTFRDKLDLADHMRIRQVTLQALKLEFGGAVNDCYCWHTCTEQYGPTELKTSLYPELDHNDQLVIRTEYHLTTEIGQVGKEEFMTPRFGCAHRSVDLWVSSVHQTTICRLFDTFCSSCQRISVCSACNTTLKCPRKAPFHSEKSGKATYSFSTERSLGGTSPVPDSTWAAQRIHPAEPSIGVDNCNELCPWTVRAHPALSFAPSIEQEILDPGIGNQPISQLYTSINMI